MDYVKRNRIPMKNHPELTEKWLQNRIDDDPALLGFGDVDVRNSERIQTSRGRLDMLLYDSETDTRYEVELQLGSTDESHIIRTIEYWDIERRRYPQYDHVAVIVAEEITSRFFNVISLFNGFIPIIAIQVSAIEVGDGQVSLMFTKVLDRMTLGTEIEDEGETVDRAYWESRASKEMLKLTDRVLDLVEESDPGIELKYNKHYIGLAHDRIATNYVTIRPRKKQVNLEIRLPRTEERTAELEDAGIATLSYDARWNNYRPVITRDTLEDETQVNLLRAWISHAHDLYTGQG